jgi:hypothetical protein
MVPFVACSSSSDGSPSTDGGSTDRGPDAAASGDSGGASQDGSRVVADSATPGPCQTYADKAYGYCSSASTCAGVTRDRFVAYCTQFYPGCMKYYSCYLGAATCAAAEACPTLGMGGCS